MSEDKSKGNVFSRIGFPDSEANELHRKAILLQQLQHFIKRHSLTQSRAAAALGITQPRVSQIVNGRLSDFSLDELARLWERAGGRVSLSLSRDEQRETAVVTRVIGAGDGIRRKERAVTLRAKAGTKTQVSKDRSASSRKSSR